ncbi:MAG: uroporphyrinogen-III synthase [Thiotrichaceae bacterium]|nr:uroporphyrinogen-III synthase [Thiotrichaceae bacterium]
MAKQKSLKDTWVVITRPAHQTENLQLKLESVCANTILFPLIEIAPPEDLALVKKQLDNLQNYDLVIFVSANAVEQTFNYIESAKFKSVKVATTGKKTGSLLEDAGVKIDFCPSQIFNSEALLATPNFKLFCEGKSIAIIRGEGGRNLLRNELLKIASSVDYINTYQRICPQTNSDLLEQYAEQGELDIILLTSGTSVDNFFSLAKSESWLNDITLLIGSPRMQKKIPDSFQGKLAIAEDPSDETLYKKLIEIC